MAKIAVMLDEELKKDFDGLCKELGLPMSTAVVMFIKKAIREKRIPFEVSVDARYSGESTGKEQHSIAGTGTGTGQDAPAIQF